MYANGYRLKKKDLLLVLLKQTKNKQQIMRISPKLMTKGINNKSSLELVEASIEQNNNTVDQHNRLYKGIFDPDYELKWLSKLRQKLLEVSPIVAIDEIRKTTKWRNYNYSQLYDGIMLDCSGLQRLYKTIDSLINKVKKILDINNICYKIGLAHNVANAWIFARSVAKDNNYAVFTSLEDVYKLPISALRLKPEDFIIMKEFGIETIKHLNNIPSQEIASTISTDTLNELNKIKDLLPEHINETHKKSKYIVKKHYELPLYSKNTLINEVHKILNELLTKLEITEIGASSFILKISNREKTGNEDYRITKRFSLYSINYSNTKSIKEILFPLIESINIRSNTINYIAIMAEHITPNNHALHCTRLPGTPLHSQHSGIPVNSINMQDVEHVTMFNNYIYLNYGEHFAKRFTVLNNHLPTIGLQNINSSNTLNNNHHPIHCKPSIIFEHPIPIKLILNHQTNTPEKWLFKDYKINIAQFIFLEKMENDWWNNKSSTERSYYALLDLFGTWWWLYKQQDSLTMTSHEYGEKQIENNWYIHGIWI
jgi:hypothetical protein